MWSGGLGLRRCFWLFFGYVVYWHVTFVWKENTPWWFCGCNFGLRDMIVEGMMLAFVVNFGMDSGEAGDILKSS